MNKDRITWIAGIFIVPVIIYFYFLEWKPETIYGDDLYLYLAFQKATGIIDKFKYFIHESKFRPVQNLVLYTIYFLLKKNLFLYYLFNVFIQSINTLVLARILNLFLKSPFISVMFSLLYGFSRLTFFNISQVFYGGTLEGLALTFFLGTIYFITITALNTGQINFQKRNGLIIAVILANMSIYTHERYIFLFPYISMIIFILPGFKSIILKHKINLVILCTVSVAINIILKTYFLKIPFLVGTGHTNIHFSFVSSLNYLFDGILSMFQINSAPDYLTGLPFIWLPLLYKFLALISAGFGIIIIAAFTIKSIYGFKKNKNFFLLFSSYFILFLFALAPALITIRLEQRWLQGSFVILILLIVIGLNCFNFNSKPVKFSIGMLFIFLFQLSDYHYIKVGAKSLYLNKGQKIASCFKHAIHKDIIHAGSKNVFCEIGCRNANRENEIRWAIADGGIFEYYQQKRKNVYFLDSVYTRMKSSNDTSLIRFNKNTDQIIYINDSITDITNKFLTDSLKNFKG